MRYVLASLVCTCLLVAGCQMPVAAPAATSAPAEEAGTMAEVTDVPEAEADATKEMAGTPTAAASEEMTGTPTAGATEEITETEELSDTDEMTSTQGSTTDPVEVVIAFWAAMNALEYEKAGTFLSDDVVMVNEGGTYTGPEANITQLAASWDAGIRVEPSSLVNIDGIVGYHVIVTENGTLLFEGEGGITIVEDGKITFDGDTSNMPPFEDPTSPKAVVTAFYVAMNSLEYDRAVTFLADDAVMINPRWHLYGDGSESGSDSSSLGRGDQSWNKRPPQR
jgi:limonene-1,2-epoxide hydrolase